jgi:micrococcal nuclease
MPRKRYSAFLLLFFLAISLVIIFFNSTKDSKQTLGVWDSITPTSSPSVLLTPAVTHVGREVEIPTSEAVYPVAKVVDGDTITVVVSGKNETIRLIGINTPESVDPRKPVECFGKEASARAVELLTGHSVRLVSDPTQGERDKYNRLLRYIFRDDGLFFNERMIEEGYAYEYTYAVPYQYQGEFKIAQEKAKTSGLGLWNINTCGRRGADEYTNVEAGNFIDKDCKDFLSQAAAQEFFLSLGGPHTDLHKLDSNKDGTVCESLP